MSQNGTDTLAEMNAQLEGDSLWRYSTSEAANERMHKLEHCEVRTVMIGGKRSHHWHMTT